MPQPPMKPFTDSRIKAALVLSPSKPAAGDINKAFGSVSIPWLLMTGTKDIANIALKSTLDNLQMYLGDLSDADITVRPVPAANNIASHQP